MLKRLQENDLVLYAQEQPESWEDAIKVSCQKLEEKGIVTKEYAQDIILSLEEHGPYIVLIPNVAMPHAPTTSKGIKGTGVSLTVFKDCVVFYDKEEEKKAKLFFTIVADNAEKHLENITGLMDVLQNDELLQALLETKSLDDYNQLINLL
ncbi:PTS sugar transporter subunit IIA [Vallitaleaceae bacterium 9-2]